ncbi:MAG: CMP/dCMP deaminase zinc-binding protein [candidate division TM6 bacterium GW2011_GWF2_32_72]|nr:MAG: CMP/dCMP deaminase zinc-binding protein [candidate division TM6 bacterium GW2011_GWF2_32_72]
MVDNTEKDFDKQDICFMQKALAQAEVAFTKNEVPIGAIILGPDNKIIARAHNQVERKNCQCYHAEILAIKKACKKLGDWRLDNCTLYVTLEPCAMCMHLIMMSRISKLIYGTKSPLFGYHLDKPEPFRIYKRDALEIKEGLCSEESLNLLKLFFKLRRAKKG